MPELFCLVSCQYAEDVGMPEYSGLREKPKGCGNCPHYLGDYVEPPVFQYDRIMDLASIRPLDLDELKNPCYLKCLYGTCAGPGWSGPGCGGCCGCLGGCQVEHDFAMTAPHLWEGDYA